MFHIYFESHSDLTRASVAWVNSASLQAFIESDGYASYFAALGIHELSPHAFLRLHPPKGAGILDSRVMVFIFSFEYPVNEEIRSRFNLLRGLQVLHPGQPRRLHTVSYRVWIDGPQVGEDEDGQLVELAMMILPFSTGGESREGRNTIQERVSKDLWVREKFNKQVKELNLKIVEEVTWDVGSAEYD